VLVCVVCTGLSAARQLRNHGYKVLVLEGADRPGGRVHTHRLEVGCVQQVSGRQLVLARNGSVDVYWQHGQTLRKQPWAQHTAMCRQHSSSALCPVSLMPARLANSTHSA
jgi:monoamine oxidase